MKAALSRVKDFILLLMLMALGSLTLYAVNRFAELLFQVAMIAVFWFLVIKRKK